MTAVEQIQRSDFHLDYTSVLPAMPPELAFPRLCAGLGAILVKRFHVLRGVKISDRQIPEFRIGIAVKANCSIIERQEVAGTQVKDPHRHRIFIEKEQIL